MERGSLRGTRCAWPTTCPPCRGFQTHKWEHGEHRPPGQSSCVSFLASLFPALPDLCICFLLCCMSPSLEFSPPKSKHLAWLARPTPRITPQEGSPGSPSYVGYHHVWGVLSETQARHLVAEAGPQRRKRYQARGGFFLCKNTAISPCKTFIVKKKKMCTCFLKHFFPPSSDLGLVGTSAYLLSLPGETFIWVERYSPHSDGKQWELEGSYGRRHFKKTEL